MHHTFARNLFLCSLEGLHPSDAVQGTPPTSILQRKNGLCIYEDTTCGRYGTSQRASRI